MVAAKPDAGGYREGEVGPVTSVLTIGTFDLLHYGHVDFLNRAAELGAGLTVGINSDRFAATFKDRPVMDEDERAYAVRQLGYATEVNDGPGHELIRALRPAVLAVGSDWARKDYRAQINVTQDWLDGRGITLAYVPYRQWRPISSTEIRRRLRVAELPCPPPVDSQEIA